MSGPDRSAPHRFPGIGTGAAAFLELLARDAPAAEYDAPLAVARVAGLPPEDLDVLETARRAAIEIRSTLARSRRREAELVALVETAADLAALRDVDAVLHAIVSRAHTLIGADVTYLTLDDPERGDTFMRVTHGSVSARFQSVRLPMGAGLGGLVAQTAKPYATADYTHDVRFRRTGDIDGAVTEEGLVAILGVPLLLGAQVIGVLFAANRDPRPFARHEVTLLATLAAHAAIAIDNARLLQASRDALTELSAANTMIREHSAAVERAASVHDKLADLVVRGGSMEGVASAVAEALGGHLAVLDTDGAILAEAAAEADGGGEPAVRSPSLTTERSNHDGGADSLTEHDERAQDLTALIAASTATGRAVQSGARMVSAVTAGPEPLGALVLTREAGSAPGFTATDQRILERAALVTALHLLISRSAVVAAERLGGDLLSDLLAVPVRHLATLVERSRRIGVDLERPYVVAAVDVAPADRARLAFGAGRLAGAERGLAGSHEGRTVLLLPGDDTSATAQRVLTKLKDGLSEPITVGVGGPATGVQAFAEAHAEAVRCLIALHGLQRTGSATGSADLGFLGLVLGGGDPREVVRRAIGPLLDYDGKRGTDLLGTVEEYFGSGRSLARTGEKLHIHVNTVTQRLDRAARLLGPDWQEPSKALEIQLALLLRKAVFPT
ncbi:MAG: GAF domain-containing protein [Catenulispora sp.]|nr:GAF domain-containing protein [Catenulispora sp.]